VTTAVVDSPEIERVMLNMTWPVRSAPSLCHDIRPKRPLGRLVSRWVPDPNDESGLVCIWVPRTGAEA
jgi:hypothetical protein